MGLLNEPICENWEVRVARKGRNRREPKDRAVAGHATVVVCRGGDCGSRRKHPDTDHRDQLGRFREALGRELVVSRCLDACEHSNVVVVVPRTPGEREKDEPVWVGEVNDPETTADLLDWIRAAAVIDSEDLPVLVQIRRFSPTRRNRQELETELRAD